MSAWKNDFDKFVDKTIRTTSRWVIRKHYTTYTTGTLAGRDDGWPEKTYTDYLTPEDFAKGYDTEANEEYELITEKSRALTSEEVKRILQDGETVLKEAKEREQLQKDSDELRRLAHKLGVNLVPKMG